MKNYVKPEIIVVDSLAEGIYASSGSGHGCDSLYMNGVYLKGTYHPKKDGYKIGRGCEGCPVAYDDRCNVADANYDGDFRPSWEISGKLPDELGD